MSLLAQRGVYLHQDQGEQKALKVVSGWAHIWPIHPLA